MGWDGMAQAETAVEWNGVGQKNMSMDKPENLLYSN